jgi:hypothetical protein
MNSRVHECEWAIDFNERGFLENRNMVLIVELDSGPGHADVGFIIVIVEGGEASIANPKIKHGGIRVVRSQDTEKIVVVVA